MKTLQMKTAERSQWLRFGDFIVKCEHVSHFALIVNFEQANTSAGLHIENTKISEGKVRYISVVVFLV